MNSKLKGGLFTSYELPDFDGSTDVCNPIGSFLLILGDGQGDVSIQEIGFVIVINVLPPQAQFLNNHIVTILSTRLLPLQATCLVPFLACPQDPPAVTFLLAGLTDTVMVLLRSALSVGTVMSMSMAARIQPPTVQLPWK